MGGIEDIWDREDRRTPEDRARARREALTPHERETEDLVDGYTNAVKHDTVLEFFQSLAAKLIELKRLEKNECKLGEREARLAVYREKLHALATELMTRTSPAIEL